MTNASDNEDMSALRSCIVRTTWRSLSSRCAISWPASDSVITPVALPPAAMAASATTPMSPTEAPP